jgi:hypothetical protein
MHKRDAVHHALGFAHVLRLARRAHVLHLLPQLTKVDGVAVTAAEGQDATRCVEQTRGMVDMMVSNACTAHKLVCILCHLCMASATACVSVWCAFALVPLLYSPRQGSAVSRHPCLSAAGAVRVGGPDAH